MILPLFTYASASSAVRALIGSDPVRFWPFAESPQKGNALYGLPYSVWQTVYGSPDNYINQLPDADNWGVQIDAYGRTPSEADQIMKALRDAMEPHGVVTAYNGDGRDQATGLFRSSLTVEFWTDR